jgi:hypothetical protein
MSHLVVYPAAKFGRDRTVNVLDRPLSQAAATDVAQLLARAAIYVEPTVDAHGVVNLFPLQPLSTEEEVAVLRAYSAAGDSRVAWHGRRPA